MYLAILFFTVQDSNSTAEAGKLSATSKFPRIPCHRLPMSCAKSELGTEFNGKRGEALAHLAGADWLQVNVTGMTSDHQAMVNLV